MINNRKDFWTGIGFSGMCINWHAFLENQKIVNEFYY